MKYALHGNYIDFDFPFDRDDENPDIVFSFGGDGAMLGAIHKYEHLLHKVKFIGINTGRLGFYNNYKVKDLAEIIKNLQNNCYDEENYHLLDFELESSQEKYTGIAVNELAITNPIHTQIIEVYINDKLFETFRGTGLLISPPTGSTAYNKSLGGSVVDPYVKAIQLTEIAPIINRVYKVLASPLILSEKAKVKLKIKNSSNIYLSVDGQPLEFENLTTIQARLSAKSICFIVKKNTDFFDRVRRAFIE
jgi:NAD+ kinase